MKQYYTTFVVIRQAKTAAHLNFAGNIPNSTVFLLKPACLFASLLILMYTLYKKALSSDVRMPSSQLDSIKTQHQIDISEIKIK